MKLRSSRGRDAVAAFVAVAASLVLLLQEELIQGASAQGLCTKALPCQDNTQCCSEWGKCGSGSAYCGAGCLNGPCIPHAGDSGWNFLTQSVFEGFFPKRNAAFYTYANFKAAAAHYPAFGNTGSVDDQKRELAAFLANIQQESGGLRSIEERNKTNAYCSKAKKYAAYPCAPGKKYYGRGPIQLTWNYNYGPCGKALGKPLLSDPDLVARDGAVAFQTALWFWMTRKCHDAIVASPPSFAGTIRKINSGECGQPVGSLKYDHMLNRVTYYILFCEKLLVDPEPGKRVDGLLLC